MPNSFNPHLRIHVLILVLGVVALVISLCLYFVKRLPNTDLRSYTTSGIGITFKYPRAFGDPRYVTLTPTDGTGIVTSGKAEQITFSKNVDLYFILATSSFTVFKLNTYLGEQDFQTLCPKPSTFDANGNGCLLKTLGNRQALVRTEYIADEGVYNLILTYSVNLSQGEYQGLKVIQSFPAIYSALNSATSDVARQTAAVQYAKELFEASITSPFKGTIDQIESVIASMRYNTTDV